MIPIHPQEGLVAGSDEPPSGRLKSSARTPDPVRRDAEELFRGRYIHIPYDIKLYHAMLHYVHAIILTILSADSPLVTLEGTKGVPRNLVCNDCIYIYIYTHTSLSLSLSLYMYIYIYVST